jgi:uncharacterized protein YndB with AHSA1/START domain
MRWSTVLAWLVAAPAAAEVRSSAPDAFITEQVVTIAAPPEAVWTRMGDIGSWWDPAHSYSGRATNLSLDLDAHGCFCERLPGERGSVEHAHIVHLDRPRLLRLSGALGPLQAEAAVGTLTFALARQGAGTKLTVTYVVGGNLRGKGLGLAPAVDGVLAHQVARLKAAAERR